MIICRVSHMYLPSRYVVRQGRPRNCLPSTQIIDYQVYTHESVYLTGGPLGYGALGRMSGSHVVSTDGIWPPIPTPP